MQSIFCVRLLLALCLLVSSLSSPAESRAESPGECANAHLPVTMEAVRLHGYGGPEMMRYETIERPSPSRGEILVAVRAVSVNPVDWKLREGQLKEWWPLEFPSIVGRDGSGTVVAVGDGVTTFHCGDNVYFLIDNSPQGTYAEYLRVKTEDAAPMPTSIPFEQAAAIPLTGLTAWNAVVTTAAVKRGQRVLVQGGAGGVGSMAVQIAKARGAYVIATASSNNREFLQSIGADEVIDYKAVRFEDVLKDLDVVIDTVGGETLARSVAVLRKGGKLVSVAGGMKSSECASAGIECPGLASARVRSALDALSRLVEARSLRVNVERVLPLASAAEAQEISKAGHVRGKIVLRMPDSSRVHDPAADGNR